MHAEAASFTQSGYLVRHGLLEDAATFEIASLCEPLLAHAERRRPGVRRVLAGEPRLVSAIRCTALPTLARELCGGPSRVGRAILFDKSPETNWAVLWHQDSTIALREKGEVAGFGPWSVKDGEHHCCPPRWLLDHIVVLRVHLDPCGPSHGPLRVIPESHTEGLLPDDRMTQVIARGPVVECCTDVGGVVAMRPHTIHSSERSRSDSRRRVLHLECTSAALPAALHWAEAEELEPRT